MMLRLFAALGTLGLLAVPTAGATTVGSTSDATVTAVHPPLTFAENAGQWAGDIRYSGSVPGATVNFATDGMTCVLTRRRGDDPADDAGRAGRFPDPAGLEALSLRVSFPGARLGLEPAGEAVATSVSHYYYGNDPAGWRTNVPNYAAVRYAGLYPGIDLVYHGRDGRLEYDFELAPGADWRSLRVRYDGVERLGVTKAGDLEVRTRFGRVIEQAPEAWQTVNGDRRPVRVRYRRLADDTFGFQVLDRIEATAPLTIDPVLHYSTYLGGTSYDEPHAIDYDFAGEAWVAGGTLSPNFPATGSPVPSANYSAFVTRLAADGQSLVWSVFLGGSSDQIAYGLDLDASGNAFVSGTTGSNDFPTTPNCYDATFNGTNPGELDMFVAKLSPGGALLYGTYLGGTDSDTNARLKLNLTGQVYVLGDAGANFPTTAGCYDATSNGASDVVLAVMNLNSAGPADLVYGTYLGGNDYDESHGLAVDGVGNAWIAGATRSPDFPAIGGPPFNGTFDAFVAEINPGGSGPLDLVYNEKFGGAGQDYGMDIAADFIGVATCGITASTNFPVTSGAWQTTYGGGPYDGFVMFLLPSSSFVFYSTYLGQAGTDRPAALHMTFGGEITVSGATDSPGFPVTAGAFDMTWNGGQDMFVSRFDQSGANLLESTFIGGGGDDIPYDFKVDLIGRRYLTGTTTGPYFPVTSAAFDTSFGGGAIDAVVLKFQPPHPEACAACASPADTCCERAPRFQAAEPRPTLSQHLLVGTREKSVSSPYAVTVFDLNSPAPTEDVAWSTVTRYNGPGNSWKADSLGSVFGLTLDEYGNIFVTHTSCYDTDLIGQVAGGGPGAIYRIDGATGTIKTFCRLPNYPDPGVAPGVNLPGLGNISYDCRHRQFFVTNLEDGRIYRIKPNGVNGTTGTIQQVFDPGVQDLGPTNWQTPIGLVPSPGWAPAGERLWAVQWHMDRVFYGVWAEDISAPLPAAYNEIRSVGLDASGAFLPGSDQHELFLPSMVSVDFSMPPSDISFDAAGTMLVGERGIDSKTFSSPHMSRSLEYRCEAGCWVSANQYQLGVCCYGANSAGGVDYDRFPFTGGPIGRVWGSADAIHLGFPYFDEVFGYQGSRPTGGSNISGILIDDDNNTQEKDKGFVGDIEAPGCPNSDLGQVCGRKFNDLNHNGVPDNGEPGMLGWTIVLTGPGGPMTAYTDEQGNYCFEDLFPGTYTLTEVTLPGWIQTAPPGGAYTFSLASAQNLSGMDFGNYACASAPPCVTPPPGLAAWWTFDDDPGVTTTADAAHLSPARNGLELSGGAALSYDGRVGHALQMSGPATDAVVPFARQLGLDAGDGSFALDAWLLVNPGAQSPRVVAEQRSLVSSVPYRTRGWALYLDGQTARLEIGTPGVTETFTGPVIPAGEWTHLAVSVDRVTGVGQWWLNGAPVPAFGFSPPAGSLFTTADLHVGQRSLAFGPAVPFDGLLDELEFHHGPLSTMSVAAVAASAGGKCREYCRVPAVTSICKDKASVTVCVNIVNQTNAPQSYHWSVAGLPAGPGCSVNGPITFSPQAGSVTVPAGGTSAPICIVMTRPAGLTTQNATACFEFSYVNDQTGLCRSCTGKIRADNSCWCVTPAQPGVVSVAERLAPGVIGQPIVIGIKHPCDPIAVIDWRVTASYEPGAHPDPLAISLNGLPPGEPVLGSTQLDTDGETEVTIFAAYPRGYDPAGLYQIVMEADTDGDGLMEVVSCTPIASAYEAPGLADVPEAAAPSAPAIQLRAAPNPFQTGATIAFTMPATGNAELAVFDLGGRQVRTLHEGALPAGSAVMTWDGRDDQGRPVGGGIYFVRLRTAGEQARVKVVKVR